MRNRRIGWGAALLAAAACGGSYSSPEGAVQTWLDALEAGDTTAVRESFTPRTQDLMVEIGTLSREAEGASGHPAITVEDWCTAFCGATVEGSTLHGDSATVRIRLDEDDVNEIPVLRGDGGWKIDLWSRLHPAVQMLRLAVRQSSAAADTTAGGPPPDSAPPAAPVDTAGAGEPAGP